MSCDVLAFLMLSFRAFRVRDRGCSFVFLFWRPRGRRGDGALLCLRINLLRLVLSWSVSGGSFCYFATVLNGRNGLFVSPERDETTWGAPEIFVG